MQEMNKNIDDLISVIVPIYNVEKYLRECLDSIINQTYRNLEIILVDDGSTDSCPQICDEYKEKDGRIKVIHKENGGLSSARNVGLNIANGKYISFIDSDDLVSKHLYEIAYKTMQKNNANIFCFRNIEFRTSVSPKENIDKNNKIYNKVEAYKEYNNVYGKIDDAIWDKIFESKLFDDIRFPEGKICEDIFTFYKLVDKSNKIIYNNSILYFYRARGSSLSKNGSNVDKFFDNKEANEKVFKYVTEKYPNTYIDMLARIEYQYIWLYNKLIIAEDSRSSDILDKIKAIYKDVIKNRKIPIKKKIQLVCIIYLKDTYRKIYKKHINKTQLNLFN